MSSRFKEIQNEVVNRINQITIKSMSVLAKMWKETFDETLCEDHVQKLSEHVEIFYKEVMDETKQRQDKIRLEIKKLRNEAQDLQRRLHVDVNINISEDIPLYTLQNMIDDNLRELRQELKNRESIIYDLLVEQESLCDTLEEEPRELRVDPLPTAEQLKEFRIYLDNLIAERDRRTEEISKLRQEIKAIAKQLEIPAVSFERDAALLTDPHIALTKENIHKLYTLRKDLEKQLNNIRESIDTMRSKLNKLWDVLEVAETVRRKFNKYTAYTQTTYDKLSSELDRCENERRANIKRFVDKTREEIVFWWEKVLYSDIEKRRFSNFTTDCYTEDLLDLHEMELKDIQDFYHKNEIIFNLFEKRTTLWNRMEALEAKASEPGRYNNRGGQLLKEEKERKTISKKLPEIEAELIKYVQEYEECSNKKFTILGEPVQDIIQRDWQKKEQAKEVLKSARKQGGQTTPFKTPILQRHNSTAKKALGSMSNIACFSTTAKRKLESENFETRNAKRSLMPELVSVRTPAKSTLRTPSKLPAFPAKPRLSGSKLRVSATKSKERRVSRGKVTKKRNVASNATITSDSMNYDFFKDYLGTRSPCRSSMVVKTNDGRRPPGSGTKPKPLQLAAMAQTRQLRRHTRTADKTLKSPGLSRTRTPSPSKKFTTTNLPILI